MRFFADLATVLVRPRKVMARILAESPRTGHVWLLFVLTAVSGMFGDLDAPLARQVVIGARDPRTILIVAGVVVGVLVLLPVLFWLYAYVPYLIGRFLGGTGEIRGVRASVAWGLAPAIWALLYRVPAALLLAPPAPASVRAGGAGVSFDPGLIADGCSAVLLFALLELLAFLGCVFVTSNTLAEAHRFSVWHALGTIVLSAIAPLVVVAAAVLAVM